MYLTIRHNYKVIGIINNLTEKNTVLDLKNTICKNYGFTVEQQIIIFYNILLKDEKMLIDYNIIEKSKDIKNFCTCYQMDLLTKI